MKAAVNTLIAVAVIAMIIAIISRLMLRPLPIVGIESRAMMGFAGALLLLAIALSVKK